MEEQKATEHEEEEKYDDFAKASAPAPVDEDVKQTRTQQNKKCNLRAQNKQ